MRDWKETKTYKLPVEEVEKLLQSDFGDKLQPVDTAKLREQRRQQARLRESGAN